MLRMPVSMRAMLAASRASLAAVLALAAGTLPGQTLANGNFERANGKTPADWTLAPPCRDQGFELRVEPANTHGGKLCGVLHRDAAKAARAGFGNCLQELDPAPLRVKRIRFRAWVRTELANEASTASLWLRVDRASGEDGFFDNMGQRPIRTRDWQSFEIVGDVAADASRVVIGVLLMGGGSAFVDDAVLELVDDRVALTAAAPPAPGLVEVRMAAKAQVHQAFDAATVRFPLPLAYRDQTPLTLQVQIDPPVAATLAITQGPGPNRVLELTLPAQQAGTELTITWQSLVLVAPTDFARAPAQAPFPKSWPAEAEPWLQSTWCCEHEHDRVRALAREIRGDGSDVLRVIVETLARAKRTVAAAEGRVTELTAVQALDRQGSCTSCANLVAALLRGSGIPARVLAGYPLWSGPLQTHYIVEAFVPGFGWYPVESTLGRAPWSNSQQVNVSIVPIEHESRERAGARPCAGGAVPYLSLTEIDAGVPLRLTGTLAQYCDHQAKLLRPLEGRPDEWSKAQRQLRERWERWSKAPLKLTGGRYSFGPEATAIDARDLAGLCRLLK
jgi:transglutaminase-like putative cysteine protease